MSESFEKSTVGDIVAADWRTAHVFEQFGIDFCCAGRRSVAEACERAAIDPDAVERAVHALPPANEGDDVDATRWSVDELIDNILTTHHAYVRSALPAIATHLTQLLDAHSARHPELARILNSFSELGCNLLQHMRKEERVLFPYIREIAARDRRRHRASPFGTIENPIRMMEREHRDAGDELRRLRELTHSYTPPPDGCETYRVCFAELAAFERDLHLHVHLEDNVLFPRAVEFERVGWRS
jgi:regulator of cell morphogenesis and NO signaling